MFFGAVENFERALAGIHLDPQALVIRLRRVPFMDITGIETLQQVVHGLRKRGVTVALCEANPRVSAKLQQAGVISEHRPEEYFERLVDAVRHSISVMRAAA
jgi:SulP family sulfate permease